jgi:hypothetical protein
LAASAVIAGLALALLLLPASAADEIDQEASLLPPNGIQTWAALDALRQTFEPAQFSLTQVDLYLESADEATTGDVTVTMEVKVVGTGTVIATEIIIVPDGFDNGWTTFDFPTVAITPGTLYAIEVSVNDDSLGLAWAWSNDAYDDGQAGHVSGMLLTPQDYDFLFRTYYEAPDCGEILFGTTPPPGGGFGTFAFSCGTLEELVTASGCPEATATFFYNKPDGTFAVYIPGTVVGIVNAEFIGIFDGEPAIEETTIFTAKCV